VVLGDGGFYFASGDAEDLQAKLTWALDNLPTLRVGASRLAVRIRQEFGWERIVAQYDEAYTAVVSARGVSAAARF
jgi:glycosyltransferase involved in cell wall biosynthesis